MPSYEANLDIQPETNSSQGAVHVRNLSKYYGEHVAIDDVTINIESGRFVTFLGPSGSGKTTILMAIAGFVQPNKGNILFNDSDITSIPPERRNFGMVFQGYALFPHMTVEDNIWFPLRVRGMNRASAQKDIRRILELVQMDHLAKRVPAELSGGQQQRVALARALVFEPNLLLLDEPLSALDKSLRADLQWEIRSLHRRLSATFVNVTHDQEEALSMSDEIVILRDGRIEQCGRPEELYARPCTKFVASFLGESNFIHGRACGDEGEKFSYMIADNRFVQEGHCCESYANEDVLISLRPENIIASRNPPDAVNSVKGKIFNSKYVGSNYYLQVETELMGNIIVKTGVRQTEIDPASDVSIWLGWNPDDSVVIQES